MNFLPPSLAAFALALAAGVVSQKPGQDPARPEPQTNRPVVLDQLRGAWKLTDLVSTNLRLEKRVQTGYLLVADDFLSLECHIAWLTDAGRREASTFFSGTHEYRLRQDGTLVLRSLIGTTMDPNGPTPVFEPLGRMREYKVKLLAGKLLLTRETDDQTFEFERVASGTSGLDFYGRKRKPAEPADPEKPATPPPKDPKDGEER